MPQKCWFLFRGDVLYALRKCWPLGRKRYETKRLCVGRKIDRNELQAAMAEMHLFTTQENFDQLFKTLDEDSSGALDFKEFQEFGRKSAVSRQVIDFIHLVEVQAVEHEELGNDKIQLSILTTEDGKNRGKSCFASLPRPVAPCAGGACDI